MKRNCILIAVLFAALSLFPAAAHGPRLTKEFGGVALGLGPSEVQAKVGAKMQEKPLGDVLLAFEADTDAGTLELFQIEVPDAVAQRVNLYMLQVEADAGTPLKLAGVPVKKLRYVFMGDRLIYMRCDMEPGSVGDAVHAQLMHNYGDSKVGEVSGMGGSEVLHCFTDGATDMIFSPLCSPVWLRGIPMDPRASIAVYDLKSIERLANAINDHQRQGPGGNLIK